jgi:CRP-like cAMP-binding protein
MVRKKAEAPECKTCPAYKNSIFCHLGDDQVQSLTEEKGHSFYKKGQNVFLQGNYPHGVFCIQSGKVKLHNLGEEGKEQILRFYGPGNIIGYRAIVSGENYFSNATAIEDSQICFIAKSTFLKYVTENPVFAMFVMNQLALDLKMAEGNIVSMAHKHVRERMAEALLRLCDFYGMEEDNSTINASLSRQELGSIAGTSAESAIRIIHEFQEMQIIRLNGKKIMIIDFEKLEKLANPFKKFFKHKS